MFSDGNSAGSTQKRLAWHLCVYKQYTMALLIFRKVSTVWENSNLFNKLSIFTRYFYLLCNVISQRGVFFFTTDVAEVQIQLLNSF